MATISPAFTRTIIRGQTVTTVTWTGASTGDTLEAFGLIDTAAVAGSVQMTGTFGGATVVMQVSNDGATWFTTKDMSNTDVSATAGAYFEFTSAGLYLRPSVSGGTGDSVDVVMSLRG